MSNEDFDPLAHFPGMSNAQHKNQKEEKLEGSINDKDNSGRTGGTGGAGSTGGSGQEDDPTTVDVDAPNDGKNDGGGAALQPEYFAPDDLGEDPMAYQYKHIVGSTGAMGGKGDAPKITKLGPGQIVSSKDMEEAAAEFERKIKTLSEQETLEQLYRQHTIAKDVISTAQRKMLSVAWAQGAIFKQMRNHILARNGNWGEEIDLILKEIEMSRRTMDKYVNINATPAILKHPYLGVDAAENIIQAMAPIRHMLDKKDPISDFFKINGAKLDYTQANKRELNELARMVIVHEKLRNIDILGDYKVTGDFLRLGKKFTPVDMAVMKDRKDRSLDPLDYMREVIAANGARPGDEEEDVPLKRRIKYFNGESVKMADQGPVTKSV